MRVNLDAIKDNGLKTEFELDPAQDEGLRAVQQSGEVQFLGPILSRLELRPIADTIEVRGRLSARLRLTCARCLAKFEQDLDRELHCTYAPRPPERRDPKAGDLELSADDVGLIFFDGRTIDTAEAVREEVLSAIPLRALCREDCRGLCPHCGTDLNTGNCTCAQKAADPRLSVLTQLTGK